MIQPQYSLILAVYLGLALFGFLYNRIVEWLEKTKYIEGYVSLAVAAGVAATLIGLAVIDVRFACIALGAFVASGSPMIAGSIWRHVTTRAKDQDDVRQTTTLAE